MNPARIALALLLLPATTASLARLPASAPTAQSAAQTAVSQLEARWVAALEPDGDRQALRNILADDYIDIDWQGHRRDKSALLKPPHASSDITQHVSGLKIRVWGNSAVATGINTVHSGRKGWTVKLSFTDVFIRHDGRWRAVSSQETLQHDRPSDS